MIQQVHFLVPTGFFGGWAALSNAVLGTHEAVNNHKIVYADSFGHRLAINGNFHINGGFVTGTVTGFDVFEGPTKIITGSGFAFDLGDLSAAIDAIGGSGDGALFSLLLKDTTIFGSDGADILYLIDDRGVINGLGGDDVLQGGEAACTLRGGDGNDTLWSGFGRDQLFGGRGSDVFVFRDESGSKVDQVHDFSVRDDLIALTFDEIGPGFLSKSEFHIGNKALTTKQHVIYNADTGALYFDADGSGATAKVKIAELSPDLALKASSFFHMLLAP